MKPCVELRSVLPSNVSGRVALARLTATQRGARPWTTARRALRQGDWKLIYYHADRRCELFNLREDRSETRNLATEQPERRDALASELRAYLQKVDAQLPTGKRTGNAVPLPGD